eukprot:974654_1
MIIVLAAQSKRYLSLVFESIRSYVILMSFQAYNYCIECVCIYPSIVYCLYPFYSTQNLCVIQYPLLSQFIHLVFECSIQYPFTSCIWFKFCNKRLKELLEMDEFK